MQSTAEKILAQWVGHKKQRDGSYRGNCPYRLESDSNAFVLRIEDGEHGAYIDHATMESGSLYELAHKMNIETPKGNRHEIESTKGAYSGLEDYATRHFAPLEAFKHAGWYQDTLYNRPALFWKTESGLRARYIDDKATKDAYVWVGDNKGRCWYGLDRAISKANAISAPLVLCNGEASTIVADYHGIPAFCGTGGEGSYSDEMLEALNNRWSGQIIIALDCDNKGVQASESVATKLNKAIIVDLGLSKGGDLADFCGLHGEQALSALQKLATQQLDKMQVEIAEFIQFVDGNSLLTTFQKFVIEEPSLFGRVIRMPFNGMRQSGGFADLMTTKKVWFIGNVSGGGKTLFSETLCDGWNAIGYNVFYVGDEWSPMELTARRIQRATPDNLKPVEYMDYLRYVDGQIQEFSQQELNSINLGIRAIRSREGTTYYMQVSEQARKVIFLEDICEAIAVKVNNLRENGIRIDVIILDYLSLYNLRDDDGKNSEENKAFLFKAWCKSLDVLGVSTVQVNKVSEDRVIHKGGFLTQHDLHWIRPDKGNLISTMNTILATNFEMKADCYKGDLNYNKPYLNENGLPMYTPNIVMVTAKNSVASAQEFSYFHFDFTRMRICEFLHPEYIYDDYNKLILPRDHTKRHKNESHSPHFASED